MLKLGAEKITALHLGGEKIGKAYLGEQLVFGAEKKPSRLPEGYTEVEYIQSSGGAYIFTGIKPATTMKLTMAMDLLEQAFASASKFFVWSYVLVSGTPYYFYGYINKNGIAALGGGGSVSSVILSADLTPRRIKFILDYTKYKAIIEGEAEKNIANSRVNGSMPAIKLLSNGTASNALDAKLYSCQIESGGKSTREFVPCIDLSGNVGLYDLVGEQFYQNAGTGTFTPGPAV